jgi:hypothetical protein
VYFNDYGADLLTQSVFNERIAGVKKVFSVWAVANGIQKRTKVLSQDGRLTGAWAALNVGPIPAFIKGYEATMRSVAAGNYLGHGLSEAELAVLGSFKMMPMPGAAGSGVWNTASDPTTGKTVYVCVDTAKATGAEPRGPCSDFPEPGANAECLSKYGKPCGATMGKVFIPSAQAKQLADDAPIIGLLTKALGGNASLVMGGSAGVSTLGKVLAGVAVLGLGLAFYKSR